MRARWQSLQLSSLSGLTGCGIRVAVIDSGVHAAHPHVQGVWGGVGIDDSGREHDDFVDRLGHGTAVAAAIREKAPEAELYAIKVFDRELKTAGDTLVHGLICARRASARIANLSLGTTNSAHEVILAQEVAAARSAGMVIVAAGPQPDARWLPGSLTGVVAVELDMRVPRDACEISIDRESVVTIRACGYPRPIPGIPPERNLQGLSFAVANATGLLARALQGVDTEVPLADALRRLAVTSSDWS